MNYTDEYIRNKLIKELEATHVEVVDISDGCGAKFNAVIVSPKFEGKSLLERHRLVNSILEEELKVIHAFSQKTLTQEQWQKKQAPGKVILHGEHSVVYGKTAVAISLDLQTSLKLGVTEDKIVVSLAELGLHQSWSVEEVKKLLPYKPSMNRLDPEPITEEYMKKLKEFLAPFTVNKPQHELSLVCFLYLYTGICETVPPLRLEVQSNIPIGAGLGSSASFSVCLAAALLQYCRIMEVSARARGSFVSPDKQLQAVICKWAFMSEKIIHGMPSGIDNSVCTYGGVISFKTGNIMPLNDLPKLRILLVNTKVSRNTKQLVEKVRNRYNSFTRILDPILNAMEEIVLSSLSILQRMESVGKTEEEYTELEVLIDMNQALLTSLGVSHPTLDLVCQVARCHALHAKLTGAGGGGFAFALLPPAFSSEEVSETTKQLEEQGFECWETQIGGPGVQLCHV